MSLLSRYIYIIPTLVCGTVVADAFTPRFPPPALVGIEYSTVKVPNPALSPDLLMGTPKRVRASKVSQDEFHPSVHDKLVCLAALRVSPASATSMPPNATRPSTLPRPGASWIPAHE